MSEPDCCDLPDLVETAIPLPWTTDGPNDHSKPQQTASISPTVPVADPVYYLKHRVITMKQLEAIKKRLPRGIDVRINSKKVLSFRVRFRKKGYPDQIKTFPDEKLAKQWLVEQERNALLGIHFPQVRSSERTLAEAIDRYIVEELPRKPGNARNVRQHLEWFRKELGDYALSSIRPSLINEMKTKLANGLTQKNQKRSPTTIRRYLASFSHLFTITIKDWEWTNENPLDKVSKPAPNPGRQRYLSKDEIKRVFHEAKKSRNPILFPIIALAIATGMRRGEIFNLRYKNLDIENGEIILEKTKNGDPRFIPFLGKTKHAVIQILDLLAQPEDLVFPSPNDSLQPYDIETAWQASINRAGIKDCRFHDLRHTTASILAENGWSLFEIGVLLGHRSTQTTKRYSHLAKDRVKKMGVAIDEIIFEEEDTN